MPLVDAACNFIEKILVGVHDHLPDLHADFEVKALQINVNRPPVEREQELVILEVKFATCSPLVGEIATRSRVAVSVHITERLRFALQHPPADLFKEPLVLCVKGLDMPTLPDAVLACTQLREELGQGLNPISAYEWWEKHRHKRFPLRSSKFHRVVESLLEQRGMKMLGTQLCAESFWGYLHTTDLSIQVFEFHLDRRMRGGVTMTARLRDPRSAAEAEDRVQVKAITHKILENNRASADRLAPSGINIGAMICGPEVGQPGACPRVIAKLFSPAQWYGPGEDSWHRWDESWCCTDRKDFLGRIVKENGRVIWRMQNGESDTLGVSDSSGPASFSSTDAQPQLTKARAGMCVFFLACSLSLLSAIIYFNH